MGSLELRGVKPTIAARVEGAKNLAQLLLALAERSELPLREDDARACADLRNGIGLRWKRSRA